MKRTSSKISYNKCRSVWDWIIQIALWASIILLIISALQVQKEFSIFNPLMTGMFSFVFIIYLVNNTAFSNTFKFLYKMEKSETLFQVLQNFFQKSPEILFNLECYQYVSQNNSFYNQDGNDTGTEQPKMKKVITFSEQNKKFKYYCWRDISGTFGIDSKEYNKKQKYFINLTIIENISFADSITYLDLKKQKDDFLANNKQGDDNYELTETKRILDKLQNKLIKLSNECPSSIKWYWYIVACLFCVVEIYKLYLLFFVIKKTFTVKKLVSSRNNLIEDDYKSSQPILKLFDDVFTFENTSKIRKKIKVKKATKEEIQEAEDYLSYLKEKKTKEKNDSLNEDEISVEGDRNSSINDNEINILLSNGNEKKSLLLG